MDSTISRFSEWSIPICSADSNKFGLGGRLRLARRVINQSFLKNEYFRWAGCRPEVKLAANFVVFGDISNSTHNYFQEEYE